MPFEAVLFSPSTGNSSKVTVRASLGSLEVTGNGETLRVDPSKCDLAAGGWDKQSLQITWLDKNGRCALSTTDPAAKAELLGIRHFEDALNAALNARNRAVRSGRFGMTVVAALALLPMLALLVLYVFRDPLIDIVLRRIPLSVDQEVGKMFEGQILASKDAVPDNDATRAVAMIVRRLEATSADKRFQFRVSVQKNRDVNAFAAPGGLIVVYTGLLEEAGSADEVAGVLAHEMAHTTHRHSMRQLIYASGLVPLMGLLVGEPDAASLFQNLGQLSELRFSRAQEEDADRAGFDTLVAARISTDGMARFFDRLAHVEGAPPSFLSTHPSSADRAAALRKRTTSLKGAMVEGFPIDWKAVQDSVR